MVDRRAARRMGGLSLHTSAATPTIAHLRLASDDLHPDAEQLRLALEAAGRQPQLTTVRTSALFPGTVALFAAAGFSTVSRLVLLRAELDTSPAPARGGSMPAGGGAAARTVAVRRREFTQLAEIDHAAFGRGWSHDAEDLLAVCAATPTHRVAARTAARRFAGRRQLTAFAIAGATATTGYLQRLSVHPSHHRNGHGAALTRDALAWMRARHLRACLVNTGVDNVAALALYTALGFRRLDDELHVMEFDLRARPTSESSSPGSSTTGRVAR